jgi:DNA-binding MarR family transcriptional regulator
VKQPRLDPRDALNRPTNRVLLALLLKNESPVRAKEAREELRLSIGHFGLAIRSLERYGLAQRRNILADGEDASRLPQMFIEATDLGREHAQGLDAFVAAPDALSPSESL